jgi:hypothetical protein
MVMIDETDELARAITELIGNMRKVKDAVRAAQPGSARALETRQLIDEMARELRRHRKSLERRLRRHPWPEDQRRIAIEQISLIRLAEAEVDGTAPEVQS